METIALYKTTLVYLVIVQPSLETVYSFMVRSLWFPRELEAWVPSAAIQMLGSAVKFLCYVILILMVKNGTEPTRRNVKLTALGPLLAPCQVTRKAEKNISPR